MIGTPANRSILADAGLLFVGGWQQTAGDDLVVAVQDVGTVAAGRARVQRLR